MTKRRTSKGSEMAQMHRTQRVDALVPAPHVADGLEADIAAENFAATMREGIVRNIFELCKTVVKSIELPERCYTLGIQDIMKDYDIYARSKREQNLGLYGRVDYSLTEVRPRSEKDIVVSRVAPGVAQTVVPEAVQAVQDARDTTPGGLQTFDYIISTSNFRRFPVGNYLFPGALIMNKRGEWCVLVVSVGERRGLAISKFIEPFLVPLLADILADTYIVCAKK